MENRLRKGLFLALLCLAVATGGCRQKNYRIKIDRERRVVEPVRVEEILFGDDPAGLAKRLDDLRSGHARFMEIFGYVINAGDIDQPGWDTVVTSFVTDRDMVQLYRDVKTVFPDIDELSVELNSAWLHWEYYFPGKQVPAIYTCITGFNNSIIVGDSVIGIGLDRYLGAGSHYYPKLGIYNYLAARMVPEKIVTDCMYGWASASWEDEMILTGEANLLDNIIHEGKLLYFTRCMVPAESDTLLFGFTAPQMKFSLNNEQQMWEYLVEHDLLFSTDPMTITRLTGEAPFTSLFTSESPGRAACWIGFRIVESYMRQNPHVTLGKLMINRDYHSILEQSKYSPG